MPQTLRYGANSRFEIDLPPEMVLADLSRSELSCLDDPAAAMAAALSDPLQFPPLSSATVAGDRIAITLQPGLPQANALVAGVVHELVTHGSSASDITIVVAQADLKPNSLLPNEIRDAVRVVIHDPNEHSNLAYLASSKAGKPIYVNRAICDADVIIPIGTFRLDPQSGMTSVYSSLYPVFAATPEVAEAEGEPSSGEDGGRMQSNGETTYEDAEEVAWLLGVQFAVQVVPGQGDGVLHILAGDAHAVAERGRALCESTWRFEIPRRAGLVVATIDGGPEQQTWDNFSRALRAAANAVTNEGAIVICSELTQRPRLAGPNCQSVPELAELRSDANVYLLSGLAAEVVEDMGMAPVSSIDEIARLSRHYDSCILVPSAQYAFVVAQDD